MKRTIAAIAVLALSSLAQAQPYVSGGTNSTSVGVSYSSNRVEPDDVSVFVALGYRWSKYFAAEVANFTPGSLRDQTLLVQPTSSTPMLWTETKRTWKANGFRLSALGTIPLTDHWAVLGRVSAYHLRTESSTSFKSMQDDGNPVTPLSVSGSSSNASASTVVPGYGLGIEARVGYTPVYVRASVEQIHLRPGMFGDGNDLEHNRLRTTMIEVRYQF